MSNLKLTPQDRQSIDFAEEERKKSLSESGAIVHNQEFKNGLKNYSMTPSSNCINNIFKMGESGYHPVYTAPANGYINIFYNGSSADLWVQNITAGYEVIFPNRGNSSVVIPVSKGDEIQFYSTNAGNTTYSYSKFIYAKE